MNFQGFQNILLNLISVRLNPAANATDATSGWVNVPAPSGVGGPVGSGTILTNISTGGRYFNISNPYTNPGTSELQVDLQTLQDNVVIFNTGGVPPQTYHTVQLKIDPNVPGTIVPNCASQSPAPIEGCISYPVRIKGASVTAQTRLPVKANKLTTLVLAIAVPTPITPPNVTGGKFTIGPQISLVPNATGSPAVNSLMTQIQGSVSGIPPGQKEVVIAENAGTSNQVAIAEVRNGEYAMQVPAGPNGTNYDIFAFGAGSTYDLVTPNSPSPPQPLQRGINNIVNFTVKSAKTGVLTGVISDDCTINPAVPIEGATVELLTSSNGTDCTTVPTPADCVVVATTSTNVFGQYPTPGRSGMPQPFNFVPSSPNPYAIRISASGFDTMIAPVTSSGGKVTCGTNQNCNFALTHAQITGTVSITPGVNSNAEVQVFAEDTGTNNIVSALPSPLAIPACGSPPCTAGFRLNVPLSPGTYDVFATSIDLYNGAPAPFTTHEYSVVSGVTPPGKCEAASISIPTLLCAGHGSFSGTVSLPFDSGTTVQLLKDGVQIEQSQVGAAGTGNSGNYSFCAPADDYDVERAENGVLVPPAMNVMVPTPIPTSTPCVMCTNGGVCPGNCSDQQGPSL